MRLSYLFTIPRGEKVTEKHLRRVLISTVVSMLLSMTCFVSTTWALFTTTVVNEGNVIEVGSFEPSVTLEEIPATELIPATQQYTLSQGKQYRLTAVNNGSAKGFCKLTVQFADGEQTEICTETLLKEGGNSAVIDFTVQEECVLTVQNVLGNAPAAAVTNGSTVILQAEETAPQQ